MTDLIIWHNPHCSKSRETLFLLQDKGYSPDVRDYLTDAPTVYQIQQVLIKLDMAPIEMMRTAEDRFTQLGLTLTTDNQTLIGAMAAHPILIERPILIAGNKAAIGRPPISVLEILP